MTGEPNDLTMLAEAFKALSETSQALEEAYSRLQARVAVVDRELEDKNRALAVSTEYLGRLLESISDGVIAVDQEGVITRFNRAAGVLLGYGAEEVVGQPFETVMVRPFDAPPSAEMRLKTRSGRWIAVNERDAVVAGTDGTALGKVKIFQDLSEINALREQVRQLDRLAAVGEMAATVAHEIRNPLGGVRGFASLLAQDIPEEDPRRRLVDKILDGARRLERVVNELLEYTRPIELSLRPTPCMPVVEAALAMITVDPDRVRVERCLDPGLKALADADRLEQVLLNVLMNAIQSLDPAGGEVRVALSGNDQQTTITVTDTGCGMTEEQRSRMFSPFYTTKAQGTGLGLAISAKIVEGHGGRFDVASAPGEGTTVHIRLARAE